MHGGVPGAVERPVGDLLLAVVRSGSVSAQAEAPTSGCVGSLARAREPTSCLALEARSLLASGGETEEVR